MDLTRKDFFNSNSTKRGKQLFSCGKFIYVAQFILIILEKQSTAI